MQDKIRISSNEQILSKCAKVIMFGTDSKKSKLHSQRN
jgi:hypothetical protein